MSEHLECDNCGNRVVPLPDNSCPVCNRLICVPDDDDDSHAGQSTGPTPLHFLARGQDDQTQLTWGSWTPYGLLVLINVVYYQFGGASNRVFIISFTAALLSVYCTRVFYRGLSELAAHLSPNSPFWEGFARTVLSFLACGIIVLVGSLLFGKS